MTMPDDSTAALLGQILAKQGELLTQMAVMGKTLEAIPDHEHRLRSLERDAANDQGAGRVKAALWTSAVGLAGAATAVAIALTHTH